KRTYLPRADTKKVAQRSGQVLASNAMVRGQGELQAVSQETRRPPKHLLRESVASHLSEPALLDEIVLILQELHRREALDTTLAVGELIHTRFFWRRTCRPTS